jgi:hypothetical protein
MKPKPAVKASPSSGMDNRIQIGQICLNDSKFMPSLRVMIGIPMTGVLRSEWVMARYGQVIPCNWAHVDFIQWLDQFSPIGYMVADARNIIATAAVEGGFEWLLFIDHDVVLPPGLLIRINDYILKKDVPVMSGLYWTKSVPSEPLIYRGLGTSYYTGWKLGDKVWVDGVPMGCTLIHCSLLKVMYEESPAYICGSTGKGGPREIRSIFETPARTFYDPEKQAWCSMAGTEDLNWCKRVIDQGVLAKAGWGKIAKRKYPFLIDTNLFCRHIDWNGTQYPAAGEEKAFT